MSLARALMSASTVQSITDGQFIAPYTSTANTDVYTFPGCNIGTPSADRLVVVTVFNGSGTFGFQIDSVTIGGLSASKSSSHTVNSPGMGLAIAFLKIPSGSSADIVVTLANSANRCCIGVYTALCSLSVVMFDSQGGTTPEVIDIEDGGAVFAICSKGALSSPVTWTGLTEAFELELEAITTVSSAFSTDMSAETNRTIDAVGSTELKVVSLSGV